MKIVDVSEFYSPTGGGVRNYVDQLREILLCLFDCHDRHIGASRQMLDSFYKSGRPNRACQAGGFRADQFWREFGWQLYCRP